MLGVVSPDANVKSFGGICDQREKLNEANPFGGIDLSVQ